MLSRCRYQGYITVVQTWQVIFKGGQVSAFSFDPGEKLGGADHELLSLPLE